MEERKRELGNERVGLLLFKYSAPAVIGMTVDALYVFVDAIFIGQGVGPLALGALSIVFPVQLLLIGVALWIGVGSASIISRALGAGNDQKAVKTVGNAFALVAILASITTTFGLILIQPLLRLFGATPAVMPYCIDYLSIYLIGTIFMYFSSVSNSIARSEGSARVAMTGLILGTSINITLDPVFIFGLGWGIRGAAIATVIALACSSLYFFLFFKFGKSMVKVKRKDVRIDFGILPETIKIGASAFARLFSASFLGILVNNSIARFGEDIHFAVLSVVYRIWIFSTLPIYGLAQGLQPIIGFNYGAKKFSRVRQALKTALLTAISFSTFFFFIMMTFPEFLFSLFSPEANLNFIGTPAMRVMSLAVPLFGFEITGACLFQALGKARPALFLNIANHLFFIPLVLIMPLFLNIWGVWFTYPAADLFAFIVIATWVTREMRILKNLEQKDIDDDNIGRGSHVGSNWEMI